VENLGDGGDVVKVRPGYARNYLIPRGLARPATAGNLAQVEALRKAAEAKAQAHLAEAKELKEKLEKTSVKIARTVGDEAKMYGSVTTRDIEEAFAAEGLKIDRRKISLEEPIKTLGLSEVKVKIHHEVEAMLRVEVIKAS
jgi:large subunit ribosomal protein L9